MGAVHPTVTVPNAPATKGGHVYLILHREEGQGLAEYALILSIIAILAVAALLFISGDLTTLLSSIGSKL
jgi:Flp pilus assembly pilin Flp